MQVYVAELTNRVNLIGIKKVTETSKEKSFKKQESVGMMLAKVNKQDLEKERVTISKTKYPYISGLIDMQHTFLGPCPW